MTPIEEIHALYSASGRSLVDEIGRIVASGGVVYLEPDACIAARLVPSPDLVRGFPYHDLAAVADASVADTWLIWFAAGDVRRFFEMAPVKTTWLAWARNDVLRWRSFDRTKRLCTIIPTSTNHGSRFGRILEGLSRNVSSLEGAEAQSPQSLPR